MKFKINLATKTYVDTRRLDYILVVTAVLLIFLLFLNIKGFATNAGEINRLVKEIAVLEGKLSGEKGVSDKEYQSLLAKIRFANGIIEKKTFNWLTLLDSLESIVPDGIAITAIEPSPKDGTLKLAGAANNFGNLRQFMENLEGSKTFTDVYLVSQSELKVGKTQKGIGFNVTCKSTLR